MELLGGFHWVMTRRGASTKVCPPQHESGDDSHPSRLDESQGYLFFSVFHTHSRYHTDILMRLKSTGCHTCIQGEAHHMLIVQIPFHYCLSVCYLSVCVSISSDFRFSFKVCADRCCSVCVIFVFSDTGTEPQCYQSHRHASRHLLTRLSHVG